MAVAEPFTTLVKLNQIIGVVEHTPGDKSVIIKDNFSNFPEVRDTLDVTLQRIESSPNKNDCLIHSFLTATCPNFRELDLTKKDAFASFYRRSIFIKIAKQSFAFKQQSKEEQDAIEKRILGSEYLENLEITMLCEYYKIRILVFETLRNYSGTIRKGVAVYGLDNKEPYILYNPGNNHFESVRIVHRGLLSNNYSYTLPVNMIENIQLIYDIEPEGHPCKHTIGEEIYLEGVKYYIISRTSEDKRGTRVCTKYGLTTNRENVLEIMRQNRLATQEGLRYVLEHEITDVEREINADVLDDPIHIANSALPLTGDSALPLSRASALPLARASALPLARAANVNKNTNLTKDMELSLIGSTNVYKKNSALNDFDFDYDKLKDYDVDKIINELRKQQLLLKKFGPQAGGRKTRRKHKTRRKRKTRRA